MPLRAVPLTQLRATDRDRFGGKAANLGEMAHLGLPVPQGFALPVEACREAWRVWDAGAPMTLQEEARAAIESGLAELERDTAMTLGGSTPLILSVRSGAAVSMPGMMDTVLNVGVCGATAGALAAGSSQAFADDCQDRLKATFRSAAGSAPPDDPHEQLTAAVEAVFRSWRTPRALAYRQEKGIDGDLGTGVVVQRMVFGNRDAQSGTGVVFSRDPSTGERKLSGEFALMRQGEDIVAGEMTPQPIAEMARTLPAAYEQLAAAASLLEAHFRAVQDIEFTVESGGFYLLQTRSAKLAPRAQIVCSVDLYSEGVISADEALARLTPDAAKAALLPGLAPEVRAAAICHGLPACPGVGCGAAVFSAERAIELSEEGDIILLRPETTPGDLNGMLVAAGVVTGRGGAASHAAVVARDLGLPCVVGCEEMEVDVRAGLARIGDLTIHEGDLVTVDGTHGLLLMGCHEPLETDPPSQVETLRTLAAADGSAHAGRLLDALS